MEDVLICVQSADDFVNRNHKRVANASQPGISLDTARIAPMAVPELKPPIGKEPPFTCTPTISPVFFARFLVENRRPRSSSECSDVAVREASVANVQQMPCFHLFLIPIRVLNDAEDVVLGRAMVRGHGELTVKLI